MHLNVAAPQRQVRADRQCPPAGDVQVVRAAAGEDHLPRAAPGLVRLDVDVRPIAHRQRRVERQPVADIQVHVVARERHVGVGRDVPHVLGAAAGNGDAFSAGAGQDVCIDEPTAREGERVVHLHRARRGQTPAGQDDLLGRVEARDLGRAGRVRDGDVLVGQVDRHVVAGPGQRIAAPVGGAVPPEIAGASVPGHSIQHQPLLERFEHGTMLAHGLSPPFSSGVRNKEMQPRSQPSTDDRRNQPSRWLHRRSSEIRRTPVVTHDTTQPFPVKRLSQITGSLRWILRRWALDRSARPV